MVVAATVAWLTIGRWLGENQPDLSVYHGVGQLADDLYGSNVTGPNMPPGGLPFTYTPFAALILLPIGLVPLSVAAVGWSLANVGALALSAWIVSARSAVVMAAMTLVSTVTAAHVLMGQLNALLLLLVLTDVIPSSRRPRWLPAGVGTGIAAAVKLTPVLIIAGFVLVGRRGPAAVAVGTAGLATALGAVAFPHSTADFVRLLPDLSSRVDVLGYFATVHNTGVTGVLARAEALSGPSALLSALVVAAGLAAAVSARHAHPAATALVLSCTAAAATPVAWLHHWVALPLLACVAIGKARTTAGRSAVVVAFATQIVGSVYIAFATDLPAPMIVLAHATPVVTAVVSTATLCAASHRAHRRAGAPPARPPVTSWRS